MNTGLIRWDVAENGAKDFYVPITEAPELVKKAKTVQDALIVTTREIMKMQTDIASLQVP